MSARKRIAIYGSIYIKSIIRPRRSIKTALVTRPKDNLTTALRNALSSILLTMKGTIMRT
jgi:hypothetical protein